MITYLSQKVNQISQKSQIKYIRKFPGYTINEQLWGILLNISETGSINYDAKHSEYYIVGNCGIDLRYWDTYLESKNVDIYGVAACIEVFNFYKENNSVRGAINEYKGAKDNKYITDKVIKTKAEANKYKHLLEK